MATLADVLRNYAPPTDSALADPIKEHFRTLPQQLATNQQAMDNTMASMYKTDMATGQPNPNYRPEAMNEFTQMMPMVGALTAWHGTPHKILGKFDISKVGTGEGAQAYGHGMYFAENPAVAKEYQKIVQGPESTAQHYLQMYKTPEIAISALEGGITPNLTAEAKKHSLDAINVLKSGKELKGNLYKVDIPDEHIPNMLDWDKPLSQQTEAIRDALKKHENINTQKVLDGRLKTRETLVKESKDTTNIDSQIDILREEIADPTLPEMTGEKYYSMYANRFNNMKDTSDYLHSLGIKGIRYFDQGSRGTVGGEIIDVFKSPEGWKSKVKVANRGGVGFSAPTDVFTTSMPFKTEAEAKKWAQEKINASTSNFVVFDPSTVKILEENGKPLTRKELIEQQLNKVVE